MGIISRASSVVRLFNNVYVCSHLMYGGHCCPPPLVGTYLVVVSVITPLRTKNASQPLKGSHLPASLPRLGVLGGLLAMLAANAVTGCPLNCCTRCQYNPRAVVARYGGLGCLTTLITVVGCAGFVAARVAFLLVAIMLIPF